MNVNTKKGPVYDPGICRCCRAIKKCRLLNVEYERFGQKEIYSEMFVDCFGLVLSYLDGSPEDRLVCATCVLRLRDAYAFRLQVLNHEQTLLQAKITDDNKDIPDTSIKIEMDLKEETEAAALPSSHDTLTQEMDTVDHHEYEDAIDSDDVPLKIHETEPKKIKKSVKEKNKMKISTKKKKEHKETKKGKKELLFNIKKMEAKLKEMDELDSLQYEPAEPRHTNKDFEKALHNTVTIVENSYVCPFFTSFSDYYCIYCKETFTDPEKLRHHTSTHSTEMFNECVLKSKIPQIDVMRIDCRLCDERITDINTFKHHITTVHNKMIHGDVENEFLKFKLTSTNLSCIECGSNFNFFHALKKHMAEHFGSWICDVCGAHYFEERMLLIHQKTHQKNEESYTCKECGKIFKSKHYRYLHIARMHTKEPAYQCTKCDAMLFSYSQRYRHMIEVHGEERTFSCNYCERSYDTRKSLREHVRRYHLKIFKHQCDLCDKRFYLPCRLKEHLATHTGERNFRCEYCGKTYPRMRGLKVHMQSHSSEKKYKCVMCNASFTQNVNLKNHMKRQHQSMDLEDGFQESIN